MLFGILEFDSSILGCMSTFSSIILKKSGQYMFEQKKKSHSDLEWHEGE